MWELSKSHCCATCVESRPVSYRGEQLCTCGRQADLGDPEVAVVMLVRPEARCDQYLCADNKFTSRHGYHPDCEPSLDNGVWPGNDYPSSLGW